MKKRDSQVIERIRQYLDENLYKQHTIQDLCHTFLISRAKMQMGFRELVHSTVQAYVIRQRLQRAAERLIESDDPIKEIALNSGYKKKRSFVKMFKAVYQVPPAVFRQLNQQTVM